MDANPGPVFNPRHYTRGYSRDLVTAHLSECLVIFHELDDDCGVPAELATSVFGVIQAMVAAVEPVKGSPADPAVQAANAPTLVVPDAADAARLVREA
jgi:hypothetical protein